MEKRNTILLVEDETKLSLLIKEELSANGFVVDIASDGHQAEALFKLNSYSLILLDISLPGKNGLDLCKLFRRSNNKVPIIMLTAFGEVQDKVDAFELGADDYLVKPFHFEELLARIKVFIKRSENEPLEKEQIITVSDLVIHHKSKSVFRAGIEIPLTAKEYALLNLLVTNINFNGIGASIKI